jgi:hypothetical protein
MVLAKQQKFNPKGPFVVQKAFPSGEVTLLPGEDFTQSSTIQRNAV